MKRIVNGETIEVHVPTYDEIIDNMISPLIYPENDGETAWNLFIKNISDINCNPSFVSIQEFIDDIRTLINDEWLYTFITTDALRMIHGRIWHMWGYYKYRKGGLLNMGVNIKDNTSEGAAFESAMKNADFNTEDKKTGEWSNYLKSTAPDPQKAKEERARFTRPTKIDYYLGIAKAVSARGTCLRRRFGAIVVKDDRVVSSGYVGAPKGRKNCCDIGKCFRMENNIPSGQRYELCRSVHAEMNAIISASKEELEGGVMYLVGVEPDGSYTPNADCCSMCKRVIINAGIRYVIIATDTNPKIIDVDEWIVKDDSLTLHEGY